MSLAKYVSSIALGLSLSACASQAPYTSKVKPEIESLYPGKVVAIRVCDGMNNCTEWRSPEGLPYLPSDIPQVQPASKLPPPRLISTGRTQSLPQKVLPKVTAKPLEEIIIDEEPVCEGDSCRMPGK